MTTASGFSKNRWKKTQNVFRFCICSIPCLIWVYKRVWSNKFIINQMQVNLSLDFKSAFKNRYCDKNGVASHMEKHRFPPHERRQQKQVQCEKYLISAFHHSFEILLRTLFWGNSSDSHWLMGMPLIIWLSVIALRRKCKKDTLFANSFRDRKNHSQFFSSRNLMFIQWNIDKKMNFIWRLWIIN